VRGFGAWGRRNGEFKQLVANLSPDKRMLEEATFTLVTHVCGFSCVLRRAKEHSRFAKPVRWLSLPHESWGFEFVADRHNSRRPVSATGDRRYLQSWASADRRP